MSGRSAATTTTSSASTTLSTGPLTRSTCSSASGQGFRDGGGGESGLETGLHPPQWRPSRHQRSPRRADLGGLRMRDRGGAASRSATGSTRLPAPLMTCALTTSRPPSTSSGSRPGSPKKSPPGSRPRTPRSGFSPSVDQGQYRLKGRSPFNTLATAARSSTWASRRME